jgi:hypothetical protein
MITHERLLTILRYDPESGHFFWTDVALGRGLSGKRAGFLRKKTGYRGVRPEGTIYAEHRLAWFYMTGKWPTSGIDHINRNPSDNRWANLREATQAQNNANMGAKNATGLKGVTHITHRNLKNPYRASIKVNGKTHHIGMFSTAKAAHEAYMDRLLIIHCEHAAP